jgi:hypothetical protein
MLSGRRPASWRMTSAMTGLTLADIQTSNVDFTNFIPLTGDLMHIFRDFFKITAPEDTCFEARIYQAPAIQANYEGFQ